MGAPLDLTGQRFGKLVAVRMMYLRNFRAWLCKCDCGGKAIVPTRALRSGNTKSCGCRKRSVLGESTMKHGLHSDPLYGIWKSMRRRCSSPRDPGYKHYGALGVRVHPRWEDFAVFYAYVQRYLGPRPTPRHSIDRIKCHGNYEPGNIRWATSTQQNNNNRRTKRIRFKGETHTLSEWAQRLGVKRATLYCRLYVYGWTVKQALQAPNDSFGKVLQVG